MYPIDRTPSCEVALLVSGSDSTDDLRALHAWLRHEDELRGRTALHTPFPAEGEGEGEMGAAAELLAVALGSGGACAVLAQSVCAWLGQRRPDVTVTVRAVDGREVTIDVRRAKDPMAVVREVERLVDSRQR
jgi:hypothetical protein